MTTIIALRGGKGSGKDTAARYLCEFYGAKQYAIADELKLFCKEMYQLQDYQLNGTQADKEAVDPRWDMSPRQIMERTGAAIRKIYGENFQTQRVLKKIDEDKPELAVISDARRLNEAAIIALWGITGHGTSLLWRLHYVKDEAPQVVNEAESEWDKGEVDLEIAPWVKGRNVLHVLLDDACQQFKIQSTEDQIRSLMAENQPQAGKHSKLGQCRATHWDSRDLLSDGPSACVLDASHVNHGEVSHMDKHDRWWTTFDAKTGEYK
jgi:hypothetical protein